MTADRDETWRLFVAIELPPAWLSALGSLQDQLREALAPHGGPRLRYVRPEGIHLTLKFLGAVPAWKLESVEASLERVAEVWQPFDLVLTSAGSFGSRRRPRVVWAGLDGKTPADRAALYRVSDRTETWLATVGFARDEGFHPHLTLARVPERFGVDEAATLAGAITGMKPPAVPPLTVASISLMRSHLGPGGARYERVASFPSSAPG